MVMTCSTTKKKINCKGSTTYILVTWDGQTTSQQPVQTVPRKGKKTTNDNNGEKNQEAAHPENPNTKMPNNRKRELTHLSMQCQ